MRIGAFLFLVGLLTNVLNIPRDINSHQYQSDHANTSPHNIAVYFRQDGGKIFRLAEDTSPTDKSDSSDDQRGSGRIDV
ncbi:hypothetical protein [[Phormidium] sp. ETS-05]|uniref:hypothetical protein n=1 Tax=[Phormidium] sp. ETS-05 TaxID=222819 RepID=UPI0018EF0943|nr:hypothetical protein [[Phormidium] sp. ETS-05]